LETVSFEKENLLYENALKEFSDKGFEKASLNSILKNTGISKGTFYYHFQNKEELYTCLLNKALEIKKQLLEKAFSEHGVDCDIFLLLQMQAETIIEYAFNHKLFYDFSVSFAKEKGNSIYEKVMNSFKPEIDKTFSKIISIAAESGALRDDIPAEVLERSLKYFFTNLGDILELFYEITDKEKLLAYYKSFIEILKNGMSKQ
jgi:AcrR family transcriptional regulator